MAPVVSIVMPTFNRMEFLPATVECVLEQTVPHWELIVAGQRVQVIRRKGIGGVLEFGTAVVNAGDGTIAGLLGASPGASTAVPAMLDVLERCFPKQWTGWQGKLREMVPSLGTKLSDDQALFDKVWQWSTKSLQLDVTSVAETTAPIEPASV